MLLVPNKIHLRCLFKVYPNNNNNLGFVFSTLKDKHPEKLDKLTELKQHLLDNNNDMAPMKVIGLILI